MIQLREYSSDQKGKCETRPNMTTYKSEFYKDKTDTI